MKAAFTIATANYLAQAKTLAASVLAYNNEYRFFIVLLDKVNGRFELSFFAPAEVLEIEQLKLPYFSEMATKYTLFELSNALKPFVAEYLLNSSKEIKNLMYFDSDILLFNSLSYVQNLLERFSIILSPHVYTPIPSDGLLPDEKAHLNIGIYNGGFFALSRSESAFAFLGWWKQQLRTYCFVDLSQGLFVDQIWLNAVPGYFANTFVLDHRGYNMAYWNLHERTLSKKETTYHVNSDSELVFYHYSGYDFEAPGQLSKYQSRYSFDQRPEMMPLYKEYYETVMLNKYVLFKGLSCLLDSKRQLKIIDVKAGLHDHIGLKRRVKNKIKMLFGL